MRFNQHYNLAGKHAFLSASQYHWIRYTDEKLIERYFTYRMAERGTRLHNLAHQAIDLGVKFPRNSKTINSYVNDAIGFGMATEQVLYYSENCFGTADAISFKKNVLRIHDLKTGEGRCSMDQLMVYSALFCLEYDYRPGDIEYELRIYQNDDIDIYVPEVPEIAHIMDRIVTFDEMIKRIRAEAE